MPLLANVLYRFNDFELDPARRLLARDGNAVPLSPKAFEVLVYLVANPGRVATREEIMKGVWPESFVEEGNLSQHISWLRKALAESADLIVTIPGRGYQFTADVQMVSRANGSPLLPSDLIPAGQMLTQFGESAGSVIGESTEAAVATHPRRRLPFIRSPRRWIAWSAVAVMLAAAVTAYTWKRFAKPPELRKLVVAEFTNSTGDEAFDRTLKRALEIDLAQSPYMDVMGGGEAAGTLRLMGRDANSALTPEIAKEACVRSNRQVMVAGAIASVGSEYLLTLEATDCNSGKQLAGAKAEAESKEKVLAALDSVAGRVRSGLGETRLSMESFQVPIAEATTTSLEALKWYSIGYDMSPSDDNQRLPFFQKAVELDPKFAMAYGVIASIYYNEGEQNLATQYFQKAYDLSGHISEKEKVVLQAHYYSEGRNDLEKGIEAYRLWGQTYPNDWAPWIDIANDYNQLGEYPQAIVAAQHALQMAPKPAINSSVLARAYAHANRYIEAEAVGQQAIQKKTDSTGLHATLFQIAYAENDPDAVARETRWAHDHDDGWYPWYFVSLQAEAAASGGKYHQSEDLFHKAHEIAAHKDLTEAADDLLMEEAEKELAFGMQADARSTLQLVGKADRASADFAVLSAECGDTAPAEHYLAAHADPNSQGTVTAFIDLPRVRAALAMYRGKPLDAIAALEPASLYELATYEILTQRGQAYLVARQGEMAERQYEKILANPGVDALSMFYPLSHLGLARAYALENKSNESRVEYEKFIATWKGADADLPVLRQARQEYAHLPAKH
jgi:DNA-binding winged helix-turn-helix (wHTH) protein/tetratricopeptide (TPR) repeat protein